MGEDAKSSAGRRVQSVVRRLLAAVSVLILLATACGDDEDTDVRSTVPSSTTEAPATTPTTSPTTSAPDLGC
jgi:hypothetical protein